VRSLHLVAVQGRGFVPGPSWDTLQRGDQHAWPGQQISHGCEVSRCCIRVETSDISSWFSFAASKAQEIGTCSQVRQCCEHALRAGGEATWRSEPCATDDSLSNVSILIGSMGNTLSDTAWRFRSSLDQLCDEMCRGAPAEVESLLYRLEHILNEQPQHILSKEQSYSVFTRLAQLDSPLPIQHALQLARCEPSTSCKLCRGGFFGIPCGCTQPGGGG
jgi:hypothetical protein